jgi:hypothetical protein
MQTVPTKSFQIKFVFLTQALSFIPDQIVNRCYRINIPRPSKEQYYKCIGKEITQRPADITNVIYPNQLPFHEQKSKVILNLIVDKEINNLSFLRECIYDLLTYNLNIYDCMWYIIENLIVDGHLQTNDIGQTMLTTYRCLKFYNNNYRPIYHLERWVVYLINKVHGYEKGL